MLTVCLSFLLISAFAGASADFLSAGIPGDVADPVINIPETVLNDPIIEPVKLPAESLPVNSSNLSPELGDTSQVLENPLPELSVPEAVLDDPIIDPEIIPPESLPVNSSNLPSELSNTSQILENPLTEISVPEAVLNNPIIEPEQFPPESLPVNSSSLPDELSDTSKILETPIPENSAPDAEFREIVLNNQRLVLEAQQQTNQQLAQIIEIVDDIYNITTSNIYTEHEIPEVVCPNNVSIPNENHELEIIESCRRTNSKMSGLYRMSLPNSPFPVTVFCELQRFGGGWIVIQQRFDGSENFNRSWAEYRDGFGTVGEEFWLGLETVAQITERYSHELLVELEDFNGEYKYARYAEFRLGSEIEQYDLTLGNYSGTAGDSLSDHAGRMFSTYDNDHSTNEDSDCASYYGGGWWFNDCYRSFLNGQYSNINIAGTISWIDWTRGLKSSRMMIHRK